MDKLVGISIFILLFRTTMLHAWVSLIQRFYRATRHRLAHRGRPPTPQLTNLENADKYMPSESPSKIISIFSNEAGSGSHLSKERSAGTAVETRAVGTELNNVSREDKRPTFERITSETGLLTPPDINRFNSKLCESEISQGTSRAETPETDDIAPEAPSMQSHVRPSTRRLSQIQPDFSSGASRSYIPSREAPSPPPRQASVKVQSIERSGNVRTVVDKTSDTNLDGKNNPNFQRTKSGKLRGRISAPVPQSFVHVNGAFVEQDGRREDTGKIN